MGRKALVWGLIIGVIIIILSYLIPGIFCPMRLYFPAPPGTVIQPYAEEHPICAALIANPLASHAPFPNILLPWVIFLIITTVIGWIVGKRR
jgi:hypothetical protein